MQKDISKNKMTPKVSVIIPTYNRANLLSRTIKSVLNQTFKDFELIIVDDDSTDNTENVVKEFQKKDGRIRYIKLDKNSGAPAHPKNVGIKNSKGEFIAFLDDDDEWLPEKLEKQLKIFNKSSGNLGLVGCNTLIVDEKSKKILKEFRMPKYPNSVFFEKLLEGNFIFTSSCIMVKKEVLNLNEVGFFDENLKYADDWDMWLRISKKHNFDFVPEFLCKHYIHGKNIMEINLPTKEIKEWEYLLNKYKEDYKKHPFIESILKRKLGSKYCAAGILQKGRAYYISAIRLNSKNIKNYFYLFLSFLGKKTFRFLYYFRKSLNK